MIEKLLMSGVAEELLLDGYYEVLEQNLSTSSSVLQTGRTQARQGEELTENDIPDEEMAMYIKTPEEVEKVEAIFDQMYGSTGTLEPKPSTKARTTGANRRQKELSMANRSWRNNKRKFRR